MIADLAATGLLPVAGMVAVCGAVLMTIDFVVGVARWVRIRRERKGEL